MQPSPNKAIVLEGEISYQIPIPVHFPLPSAIKIAPMTEPGVITTDHQKPIEWILNDQDFIATLHWKKEVPNQLKDQAEQVSDPQSLGKFLSTWHQYFIQTFPQHSSKQAKKSHRLFLWLPKLTFEESSLIPEKASLKKQSAREEWIKRLETWIDQRYVQMMEAPVFPCDVKDGLMGMQLLLHHVKILPLSLAWTLWKLCWLWTKATEAEITSNLKEWDGKSWEIPQYQTMLPKWECLFKAGVLFSDLHESDRYRNLGANCLVQTLADQTDEEGHPFAQMIPLLADWIGGLSRSLHWSKMSGFKLMEDQDRKRFRSLCETLSACCDASGNLAFYRNDTLNGGLEWYRLLEESLKLAGSKKKSLARSYLHELNATLKGKAASRELPRGKKHRSKWAFQSDVVKLASLRNNWTVGADQIVVRQDDVYIELDFVIFGQPLISGSWNVSVKRNQEELTFTNTWKPVCWHSDRDVDYLELQIQLDEDVRIDRQILLSRDDHFALLMDHVVLEKGDLESLLQYQAELPLVAGLHLQEQRRTRESTIRTTGKSGNKWVRVFPLFLPQFKTESVPGSCHGVEFSCREQNASPGDSASNQNGKSNPLSHSICLTRTGRGGLSLPLFFDWSGTRKKSDADWRQLTVTENRRVSKPLEASGFRLRCGETQWLLYHSLTNSLNPRAVLGHHTSYETVVGYFEPSGDVTPLLLVE